MDKTVNHLLNKQITAFLFQYSTGKSVFKFIYRARHNHKTIIERIRYLNPIYL